MTGLKLTTLPAHRFTKHNAASKSMVSSMIPKVVHPVSAAVTAATLGKTNKIGKKVTLADPSKSKEENTELKLAREMYEMVQRGAPMTIDDILNVV